MTFELEITFLTNDDASEWVEYVTVEEHFCGELHQNLDTVKMIFHHTDDIKSFENLALDWSAVVTYGIRKY